MTDYRPACVVWELTLACNLKCLHCGSTAGGRRAAELTPEEALKLCADMARAAGLRQHDQVSYKT